VKGKDVAMKFAKFCYQNGMLELIGSVSDLTKKRMRSKVARKVKSPQE
jgi:hypothetical protein